MHFLSLFGLIAVTAGLIFYAMETFSLVHPCIRHRLRDGRALRISASAWPFAVIEVFWMIVALFRWRSRKALQIAN
jgi:hypothetical protein